ncbi:hypothetical protein AAE02nite_07780 [Adhaeribacter aerolatus]|uniref:Peptidoglycan peptidase n=2 Tax=Adhaeribacter aerolatus TaxID=670289 RepID=A0A512ATU0_9BACT|nr:hypothetical protein AAE02nite_07780 [Adhaeribacter aerolatus]
MGIIYEKNEELYVYEAVQPVKLTKFENWIKRGKDSHFVVKRLKESNRVLNTENLIRLKKAGEKYKDKDYDLYFGWSDDKIYCSELVWKMYKEALNIELGSLQKLKEFNLNNKFVKKKMEERYGNKIPLNEKVISPSAIFESNKLETVI